MSGCVAVAIVDAIAVVLIVDAKAMAEGIEPTVAFEDSVCAARACKTEDTDDVDDDHEEEAASVVVVVAPTSASPAVLPASVIEGKRDGVSSVVTDTTVATVSVAGRASAVEGEAHMPSGWPNVARRGRDDAAEPPTTTTALCCEDRTAVVAVRSLSDVASASVGVGVATSPSKTTAEAASA